MLKKTKHGFTVVELIIVIVVIAILASITIIAYRETQKNARNEKFKTDSLTLQSAVDEYYAENGNYPAPSCPADPGTTYECHNGQAWQALVSSGHLAKIPRPSDSTHYVWRWGSNSTYAILVPIEPTNCKLSKGTTTGWFGSISECGF